MYDTPFACFLMQRDPRCAGCDCLGSIHYFDALMANSKGTYTLLNRILHTLSMHLQDSPCMRQEPPCMCMNKGSDAFCNQGINTPAVLHWCMFKWHSLPVQESPLRLRRRCAYTRRTPASYGSTPSCARCTRSPAAAGVLSSPRWPP